MIDWTWIGTSWTALLMVVLTTLGIYVSVIILTRVAGLRSFSKMSSFDFAITVAIGSVIASTIVAQTPPLVQAAMALAALYGVQMFVAFARTRWKWVRSAVDNTPLLLMNGQEILHENLKKAKVTEADLIAKLREANVIRLSEIRAVVMEATGDISVLHGDPDGPGLDDRICEGVTDGGKLYE